MTMPALWRANQMEAMNASSTNAIDATAIAASYETPYATSSMRPGFASLTDYIETPDVAPQTTIWVHFDETIGSTTGTTGATWVQLHNSSGTAVFRLQFTGTGIIQGQYWNGASWTNIGSTFNISSGARYTHDLKLVCGASGSFELYSSGGSTPVLSGSASMTSVNNVSKARWYCCSTQSNTLSCNYVSQIILADESTVGWKYGSKTATSNSAVNTGWLGSYTDVDDLLLSTADFIEATTANEIRTFLGAAMSLGGTVKEVSISMQARNVSGGLANMQGVLRRGSTNYFSSNLPVTASFGPVQAAWTVDPSTGTTWSLANAAAAATEFGVKAIA